jgi:hypothetical protein
MVCLEIHRRSMKGESVTRNLHLVFSKPPEWLSEAEYNRWYDFHLGEILVVPGFAAARRYRLQVTVGAAPLSQHTFLSLYEMEGDPAAVMRELDKEGESGRMALPEWFPEIRFTSFNGLSLGNGSDPVMADHLYLVFSSAPPVVGEEDYVAWYRNHLAENLTAQGFLNGWRFRLVPVVRDPAGPTESTHLALYEVEGDLAALREGLAAARESGRVSFPQWFDQIRFVSFDATALGARVTARG